MLDKEGTCMPETMMNKFDTLVSSSQWNAVLGLSLSRQELSDLITEVLGIGDERSISFWLGKYKIQWVKQKKYLQFPAFIHINVKESIWKVGFLERHGYIELINGKEQIFKIIKNVKLDSPSELVKCTTPEYRNEIKENSTL
jgi:hypothetical protein